MTLAKADTIADLQEKLTSTIASMDGALETGLLITTVSRGRDRLVPRVRRALRMLIDAGTISTAMCGDREFAYISMLFPNWLSSRIERTTTRKTD